MNNLKSQITQLKIANQDKGLGARQIALGRYHSQAISKLPRCDQVDIELFPLHKAGQGTPDYAQEIFKHLKY